MFESITKPTFGKERPLCYLEPKRQTMNASTFLSKLTFPLSFLLSLVASSCFSQYTIIPTGTTTDIDEIRKLDNLIVINGDFQFIQKCYNECDELIPLSLAVPNYASGSLTLLDTNRFYTCSYSSWLPYTKIVSKTTDGGQTWTQIFSSNGELSSASLLVFDTNRIAVTPSDEDYFYLTQDGGENWTVSPSLELSSTGLAFKINDSLAVLGGYPKLAFTNDRADTWSYSDSIPRYVRDLFAPHQDSIYLVGGLSSFPMYFSYFFDGIQGTRVHKELSMIFPIGLNVVSANEIYIVGQALPESVGRILKTTDLGNTWSYYNVTETTYLSAMTFLNDSIALIGGDNGFLAKWNKNSPMTEWGVGLNENQLVAFASVKPNPATEQQQLEISTVPSERVQVEIVDLQGRKHGLVYSGTAESSSLVVSIDVSQLSSGTYMYSLIAGDRKGHVRFVKQ